MTLRAAPALRSAARLAAAALLVAFGCSGVPRSSSAASVLPRSAVDARLPRPRPGPAKDAPTAPEAAPAASTSTPAPPLPQVVFGFRSDPKLKAALDALTAGQYGEARFLAAQHDDPLAHTLVDWFSARDVNSGLSAKAIITFVEQHPDWPERDRITLRAEQAFHALGPSAESVLTFYSRTPPRSVGGNLALADALRKTGRVDESTAIVRDLWRDWPLNQNQAAALLGRFAAVVTRDDHLYRFRRLVLNGRESESAAEAERLGPGYADLAAAVIAVDERRSEGVKLLRALPANLGNDPLAQFAQIRLWHRDGRVIDAAKLLLKADPDADLPGDPDIWWDERRDLSRVLLDQKAPDLAYRVAAGSKATGDGEQVEEAFHAGWYALRFLNDPKRAEPHFRRLATLATLPRTRARAYYWLGRTFEAERDASRANGAYRQGASFGGSFYGQLSREKLGLATTGLERSPPPSAIDRLNFADRDCVRAIKMLAAAGYADRTGPFFEALARSIETPGEATLLTMLARRIGQNRSAMVAAAIAEQRGLAVESLPAPFFGVPTGLTLPSRVDRALVYSVVRQESAFNHQAMSHVGARGLMQLMPATAKATALRARLPYSAERLTADPWYNATLGAHHLDELLQRLGHSYVLTFAAYNAGPSRVRDWLAAYGDLRNGTADPVDWIERIPFDETRNYVQKVMENLQVYRSRIGYPLSLSEDLVRGAPQG